MPPSKLSRPRPICPSRARIDQRPRCARRGPHSWRPRACRLARCELRAARRHPRANLQNPWVASSTPSSNPGAKVRPLATRSRAGLGSRQASHPRTARPANSRAAQDEQRASVSEDHRAKLRPVACPHRGGMTSRSPPLGGHEAKTLARPHIFGRSRATAAHHDSAVAARENDARRGKPRHLTYRERRLESINRGPYPFRSANEPKARS